MAGNKEDVKKIICDEFEAAKNNFIENQVNEEKLLISFFDAISKRSEYKWRKVESIALTAIQENASGSFMDAVISALISTLDYNDRKSLGEELHEQCPEFAEKIIEREFIFDDIAMLEDSAIQEIVRETDIQTIARALKKASGETKNRIFSNMSKRASAMLQEDMEFMGPLRVIDIEESQQEIINQIKKNGRL